VVTLDRKENNRARIRQRMRHKRMVAKAEANQTAAEAQAGLGQRAAEFARAVPPEIVETMVTYENELRDAHFGKQRKALVHEGAEEVAGAVSAAGLKKGRVSAVAPVRLRECGCASAVA